MKASANPFRSSSVEQIRYALPAQALESLLDQALKQSCSGVLGPKGSGKTTLLEDLEAPLRQRGLQVHWARLQLESSRQLRAKTIGQLQHLGTQHVCLFDGAEVLNFWQWRRVCHIARSNRITLIATLHRKRGVPILLRTQPDWRLAQQFVRQLAGTHYSEQLLQHAQQAFQASQGNMREVFRTCYLVLAHRQ
jgi:energy-coupling factor transporter ATP-binding protein EcfA2